MNVPKTPDMQGAQQVNSLESHWMPFTANRAFKQQPRLVVKSEGMYMWDHHGGRIVDGSSALFTCALGHGRREIADAVHRQMLENDYSSSFGIGHPGSFKLADRLAAILPEPMNHVFFCCSGSEAVDSALKIAMAYHRARGDGQRVRFVSRERAYHGVNIGGVSLSGMVRNRETFPVTMPNIVHMRHTWTPEQRFSKGQPETGAEMAEDLLRAVQTYGGSTIAACFVEPIAGSTGTLVPPKGYLERLRQICDAHGILLVFDEVITAFGRTGHAFAADAFGVVPDMITMAKAITNGAIPMGAVAVRDEIYETVTGAAGESAIELFHGYTYSAHPAACAAGLATLEVYEREGLFERARDMSTYFLDQLWTLADHPLVYDIRGYGMMGGVEVHPDAAGPGLRGMALQREMFWNGLHIKFTGDVGIVAPALIAEREHIDEIIDRFRQTLDAFMTQ